MNTIDRFGVHRSEAELRNGTRIVFFKRKGMPISIRASFLSGSRFDPVGKEGLSHYLEHMIVAGSKKFPSKDKLAEYIEQYGGEFGAFTGSEVMAVNVEVPDFADINIAIDVLHEILLDPLFDKDTIDRERKSIYKEIGERESNPRMMLWELYRLLFYQETVAGRSTLGSREILKEIGKKDLLDFYNEYLTSERMLIVISGDINEKDILEKAESKLSMPKSKSFQLPKNLHEIRNEKIITKEYKDSDQVHLMFGFRTEDTFSKDIAPLGIIASVLGGGRASTLSKKLRYEHGLVYSVWAMPLQMSDSGTWVISTSTAKENVQEVINIIVEELCRVRKNGLSMEEINFAKNKIVKSKLIQMQTSDSWVDFHSYPEIVGKKGWTIADHMNEIQAITTEQVKEVADKYFTDDKWYLAMCGNIEKEEIKVNI